MFIKNYHTAQSPLIQTTAILRELLYLLANKAKKAKNPKIKTRFTESYITWTYKLEFRSNWSQ